VIALSTNKACGFHHHPDYDKLPECLKNDEFDSNPNGYTPKEYAWLPQVLKDSLIEDETTPETFDD